MFAEDRYFDVEVEYAKADPEDLVALITVTNRGPVDAHLDVLASIWFRNTWAAGPHRHVPLLAADGPGRIVATHADLGERVLSVDAGGRMPLHRQRDQLPPALRQATTARPM